MPYYHYYRPLLFKLPPEIAHRAVIRFLQGSALLPAAKLPAYPRLTQKCFGLVFENPLGLAAGFDKNAEAYTGILKRGFGFTEVGSITPRPQFGNPKPRIFRLVEQEAVINRLGFNNHGMEIAYDRLLKRDRTVPGVLGVNIGRNKISPNTPEDYLIALDKLYALSDYITVNISSPNTPGLRQMQEGQVLQQLLDALQEKRTELEKRHNRKVPMLIKIAPDMTTEDAVDLAHMAQESGISGLIISNTTLSRDAVAGAIHAEEKGGLSGKPLLPLSTQVLKTVYKETKGALPLIGVGGISSAEDAYLKIRSGASLIQLYTSLIYKGFCIVPEILEGLDNLLARDGFSHISDAIGVDAR